MTINNYLPIPAKIILLHALVGNISCVPTLGGGGLKSKGGEST